MARDKIERQLENSVFVEGLIQTLIVKARYLDNVDFEQLKRLLIGLEEIRLELEYRD